MLSKIESCGKGRQERHLSKTRVSTSTETLATSLLRTAAVSAMQLRSSFRCTGNTSPSRVCTSRVLLFFPFAGLGLKSPDTACSSKFWNAYIAHANERIQPAFQTGMAAIDA